MTAAMLALGACDRGTVPPVAPRPSPPPSAAVSETAKPAFLTSADVDALIEKDWKQGGVHPTDRADDATWLRRTWLDVVGTIPPPEDVVRFLAGPAGDAGKRARMLDELLASPLWAKHWTAYWDDVWMGGEGRGRPDVDRGAFRGWLHDALARDVPYDRMVTELLTATGANSDGGLRRVSEASDGTIPPSAGVNGAVNWTLRYTRAPSTTCTRGTRPTPRRPTPRSGAGLARVSGRRAPSYRPS